MESIRFYQGQEDIVVVEKKNYAQSIFREQYTRALLQLERMVASPKDDVPSILAFCGDRGEGKSSCMETVREMMKNINSQELSSFMDATIVQGEGNGAIKLSSKCVNLKQTTFELLRTIDPAFFDERHNVLELVLGEMFLRFKMHIKDHPEIKRERKNAYERLEECFHDAKWCLTQMERGLRSDYDPIEELDSLSVGSQLREKMSALLKEYLDFWDPVRNGDNAAQEESKRFLVVSIDDLDLNVGEAYKMAEQIRKYLVGEHCILLISLKVDQLIEVVANYLDNQTAPNKSMDTPDMAAKYLTKLIPMENRVVMPKVYDLCDNHLQIIPEEDAAPPVDYNSVKEAVVQLIYIKTRYLFYNSKGGVSLIVPNNLRNLRHLVGMLMDMPDFVDNNHSMANKHAFKAYFYQTWVHQLSKEDQQFVQRLTSGGEANDVNKLTVSKLSDYIAEKESNDLIADIVKKSNYSYNISVGDVFYLINYIERSNMDEELKWLLFFVKSFYGIRLYEYYDVITERESELFPEPTVDGEVYKSDGWFKRTNQLQRFVNGSYFTYISDDMLPKTKLYNAEFKRDLRVYSAKSDQYKETVHNLKAGMQQYDGMNLEEKTEFKRKFRVAEMLAMCTKKAVKRKEAGQYENVRRDFSEPYYLTNYHKSTGYLVFDLMAPFYNILNLKYTYGRFDYMKGKKEEDVDFYEFALQHEWSLLRRMIDFVRLKEHNEDEDLEHIENTTQLTQLTDIQTVKKKLLRLISNASIRNGDVLLAMMENCTSRRANMHNIKDNMNCLKEFYREIINTEMRTYNKSLTTSAYIIRFVFLEAIIELLNNQEERELFRSIYESGLEQFTYNEEDAYRRFNRFFESFKTTKKNTAVVSDLIRLYPEEMRRLGESQLKEMFAEKQQYPHKEIAKILSERMNTMVVEDEEMENPDIEE